MLSTLVRTRTRALVRMIAGSHAPLRELAPTANWVRFVRRATRHTGSGPLFGRAGYGETPCFARQATAQFFRRRLRSRTPGPPPFSSMNSIPAAARLRLGIRYAFLQLLHLRDRGGLMLRFLSPGFRSPHSSKPNLKAFPFG